MLQFVIFQTLSMFVWLERLGSINIGVSITEKRHNILLIQLHCDDDVVSLVILPWLSLNWNEKSLDEFAGVEGRDFVIGN